MSTDPFSAMRQSIIDGAPDTASGLAQQALATGTAPLDAINNGYVPGMHEVGEQFARGQMFLPDMMASAEAMRAAMSILDPALRNLGEERPMAGTVVLGTTNDREWQRLAREVLHRPDLADDPRYATNAQRCERRAELDEVIAAWAASLPIQECRKAAEAAQLGHARLNSPTDVLSHPQLLDRDRWREVGSPVGPIMGLLPPPEVAGWDWRMDPVPGLGEHTGSVLRELGFTDAEIAKLQ